jgi:hypothetical protein
MDVILRKIELFDTSGVIIVNSRSHHSVHIAGSEILGRRPSRRCRRQRRPVVANHRNHSAIHTFHKLDEIRRTGTSQYQLIGQVQLLADAAVLRLMPLLAIVWTRVAMILMITMGMGAGTRRPLRRMGVRARIQHANLRGALVLVQVLKDHASQGQHCKQPKNNRAMPEYRAMWMTRTATRSATLGQHPDNSSSLILTQINSAVKTTQQVWR